MTCAPHAHKAGPPRSPPLPSPRPGLARRPAARARCSPRAAHSGALGLALRLRGPEAREAMGPGRPPPAGQEGGGPRAPSSRRRSGRSGRPAPLASRPRRPRSSPPLPAQPRAGRHRDRPGRAPGWAAGDGGQRSAPCTQARAARRGAAGGAEEKFPGGLAALARAPAPAGPCAPRQHPLAAACPLRSRPPARAPSGGRGGRLACGSQWSLKTWMLRPRRGARRARVRNPSAEGSERRLPSGPSLWPAVQVRLPPSPPVALLVTFPQNILESCMEPAGP